tara:strand:+ start:5205 stop:5318 length:114 start_codon:yes stop_codon:yes gene_type:complete
MYKDALPFNRQTKTNEEKEESSNKEEKNTWVDPKPKG